jgi:gamma-glutamyl hydrolase
MNPLEQQPKLNMYPIIGVLSVPISKTKRSSTYASYIPHSYMKWIEMSGARTAPIIFTWDPERINGILSQVNGVLFPGGSIDRTSNDDFRKYINAYKQIINYAKQQTDSGNHFPLWSTCLGFEFMMMMEGHTEDEVHDYYVKSFGIETVDARSYSVPLEFMYSEEKDGEEKYVKNIISPLFSEMSLDDITKYQANNVFYMNHGYGFPLTPELVLWYSQFIHILAKNKDKQGLEYVSAIKYKHYPFYGVQFHPEKPNFEWLDDTIPHNELAINASTQLSNFFINEARKNHNQMIDERIQSYFYTLHSRDEVLDIIEPHHKKNAEFKSAFERSYFFTPDHRI